jgi:hypothetical protein
MDSIESACNIKGKQYRHISWQLPDCLDLLCEQLKGCLSRQIFTDPHLGIWEESMLFSSISDSFGYDSLNEFHDCVKESNRSPCSWDFVGGLARLPKNNSLSMAESCRVVTDGPASSS